MFFSKVLSIAVSVEYFKFFDTRAVKWRSLEILAKLNGKDIYWQFLPSLWNIRVTFSLKWITSTKLLLLINKWIFDNFPHRFDRLSSTLRFYFSFFDFADFLTAFAKNLMKRPPVFMIDIKSLYKLLLSRNDLRSRNFWQ